MGPPRDETEPVVSVQLVTKNDGDLSPLLEAIRHQSHRYCSLTVIDSSDRPNEEFLKWFPDALVVAKKARFLEARSLANELSTGEYALLLDATRIPSRDCVARCLREIGNADMLILPEGSIGTSTLSSLFRLERGAVIRGYENAANLDPSNGLAVPRFYKRSLLTRAIQNVRKQLPVALWSEVAALEDRMIYLEASRMLGRVAVASSILLSHVEDNSFRSLFGKYYRYGMANRFVQMHIPAYRDLASPRSKLRLPHGVALDVQLASLMLSIIRGIPFFLGYSVS